ncbi:MAG: nucleoside hydrolase, partial [Chitinophagales bacterium]|nr:nucleoside hydrolase [Chitinophagales bacterium]
MKKLLNLIKFSKTGFVSGSKLGTLLIFLSAVLSLHVNAQTQKPVSIIYDSDMGPMIDDVAAISVLYALQAKGEARILATLGNNYYPGAGQVFDIFNTYFGYPNMPIGLPKSGAIVRIKDEQELDILGGWTDKLIEKFPSDILSDDLVPDAVDVYRKILSEQPDHSVTIVSVGFLTNLSNLLCSEPDKYSELSGKELIKRKVEKLIAMAGTYTGPHAGPWGPYKEYNLYMDAKASKHVFEQWPGPLYFIGFQLGLKVKIGNLLINNKMIKNSPVKYVFGMKIKKNRSGFDPIAALVAVRGIEPYFDKVEGHIIVNWDGT